MRKRSKTTWFRFQQYNQVHPPACIRVTAIKNAPPTVVQSTPQTRPPVIIGPSLG